MTMTRFFKDFFATSNGLKPFNPVRFFPYPTNDAFEDQFKNRLIIANC